VFTSRFRGGGKALPGRHEDVAKRLLARGAFAVLQAQCCQESEAASELQCLKDAMRVS
jgi:hypothetical protein